MRKLILQLVAIICLVAMLSSCYSSQKNNVAKTKDNNQEIFWQSLQELCGKAYKGTVIAAPANDTAFKDKVLVMHVRACEEARIRIPFFVGENRSRTWVFTKTNQQLSIKT